ncbi:MAG: hypothetical protein KDD51_15510 [Bdellovibrionales bacterium]|nr:hypothetical protein [Bdellovibrionales bacterium]
MFRHLLVYFFFGLAPSLYAVTPVLVPADSEIYPLFDRLDSYQCLRQTLRLLKPQTYADLRRGIFLPEGTECRAPVHLLQRTRVLEPASLANTVGVRAFLSRLDLLSLPGMGAVVSPTFPLRDGRPTVDGANLLLEAAIAAGGAGSLGFSVGATAGYAGGWVGYDALVGNVYLNQAYIKVHYEKLELLYGRIQPGFGDARHGTLLFSRATHPISMFRLSLRPVTLGDLGLFGFDVWWGQQDNETAVDYSHLLGLAFALRPTHWLEFGVQQLHQFGGIGAPVMDLSNFFRLFFYATDPGYSDSVFAFHMNLWLFEHYAKLYTQWLVRDFQQESSFLVGLALPRVGMLGFNLEYVQTGTQAYSHSFWTQGLSYKRTPLGHPLGNGARGFYADVDIDTRSEWEPSIGVRYEERARNVAAPETRYGAGAALRRKWDRYDVQLAVHYDRVSNHLFTPNLNDDVFTAFLVGKYILF